MSADPRRDIEPSGPLGALTAEVAATRVRLEQALVRLERLEANLSVAAAMVRDAGTAQQQLQARIHELAAVVFSANAPAASTAAAVSRHPSPFPKAAPSAELTIGGTRAIVDASELSELVKVYRRAKWWRGKATDVMTGAVLTLAKWGLPLAAGWLGREVWRAVTLHVH